MIQPAAEEYKRMKNLGQDAMGAEYIIADE